MNWQSQIRMMILKAEKIGKIDWNDWPNIPKEERKIEKKVI